MLRSLVAGFENQDNLDLALTSLRGSVCKNGLVYSGSKNSLPSNFAQ